MSTDIFSTESVEQRPSSQDLIRQVLVVVATVSTIVVNGLANALPINGQQTGDISDRFDVFFVPAGYVFSIWGLIYIGMIAYSVFQALPSQRKNPRLQSIGYVYVLSALANIVWIFLWHYEVFPATLAVMLLLLISLIVIYQRLGTGQSVVSTAEKWLVRVPFSLYLGWITVATIANATSLLDYLGWSGWGISPQSWAVIMLLIAAVVGLGFSLLRGDIAYVLVIGWALAGIMVKHSDNSTIAALAGGLAIVVVLSLFIGVPRHRATLKAQVGAEA
ncbi:MAG: tryptophan-rich sensory protein [Caldilineaceae bacterium]|nr:tryptophan-rich sensory protein [Caldilineaceae bacterium]